MTRDRYDEKAFLKAWNDTFQQTGIGPCPARDFLNRYFEAEAERIAGDDFERACDAVVSLSESGKSSDWRSLPVEVLVRTAIVAFQRDKPKRQSFWLRMHARLLDLRAWFRRHGW